MQRAQCVHLTRGFTDQESLKTDHFLPDMNRPVQQMIKVSANVYHSPHDDVHLVQDVLGLKKREAELMTTSFFSE